MKIEADVVVETNVSKWVRSPDLSSIDSLIYEAWEAWEKDNLHYYDSCLPSEVADRVYGDLIPEVWDYDGDLYDFGASERKILDGVAERLKGVCTEITDVEIDYRADAIKAHVVLDEKAIEEIEEEHDYYYGEEELTAENASEYLSKTYCFDVDVDKDWQDDLAQGCLYESIGGSYIDAKWLLSMWQGSDEEYELMEKAQEIAEEKDLDWEDVFEEMFPAAYGKFNRNTQRDY